jgi:hypothetical protein
VTDGLEKLLPDVECAPGAGQIALSKLTMDAGLSEDGSHGQTSNLQRRVQAAGSAGIPRGESLHGLNLIPDPDLGGEVRGRARSMTTPRPPISSRVQGEDRGAGAHGGPCSGPQL